MPVYEYQCTACHKEFEYQQRMSDPDKTTCEVCGGALERLISRTAFTLKGSGWYKDLYSSSKPGETKSEGSSETTAPKTDSGTSTTTKTESTPAATPAAPTSTDKGGGGGSSTSASSTAAPAKAS